MNIKHIILNSWIEKLVNCKQEKNFNHDNAADHESASVMRQFRDLGYALLKFVTFSLDLVAFDFHLIQI